MLDPLPESVIWDYMAKARQNERERIAEWLRQEPRAAIGLGRTVHHTPKTLADAIERKEHYGND